MTHQKSARRAAALFSVALVAVACSSTNTASTNGGAVAPDSGGLTVPPVVQPQAAQAATQIAFKGTNRNVDPTPRPAAKGKHIVVISAGQAASSSSVPSNGAVAAAKAAGWQVDLYDAKLKPANYPALIRQAIAANVDGIILDAIDCNTVKQPLAGGQGQEHRHRADLRLRLQRLGRRR